MIGVFGIASPEGTNNTKNLDGFFKYNSGISGLPEWERKK